MAEQAAKKEVALREAAEAVAAEKAAKRAVAKEKKDKEAAAKARRLKASLNGPSFKPKKKSKGSLASTAKPLFATSSSSSSSAASGRSAFGVSSRPAANAKVASPAPAVAALSAREASDETAGNASAAAPAVPSAGFSTPVQKQSTPTERRSGSGRRLPTPPPMMGVGTPRGSTFVRDQDDEVVMHPVHYGVTSENDELNVTSPISVQCGQRSPFLSTMKLSTKRRSPLSARGGNEGATSSPAAMRADRFQLVADYPDSPM
jgi:hypothetical protein